MNDLWQKTHHPVTDIDMELSGTDRRFTTLSMTAGQNGIRKPEDLSTKRADDEPFKGVRKED